MIISAMVALEAHPPLELDGAVGVHRRLYDSEERGHVLGLPRQALAALIHEVINSEVIDHRPAYATNTGMRSIICV